MFVADKIIWSTLLSPSTSGPFRLLFGTVLVELCSTLIAPSLPPPHQRLLWTVVHLTSSIHVSTYPCLLNCGPSHVLHSHHLPVIKDDCFMCSHVWGLTGGSSLQLGATNRIWAQRHYSLFDLVNLVSSHPSPWQTMLWHTCPQIPSNLPLFLHLLFICFTHLCFPDPQISGLILFCCVLLKVIFVC